MGNTESHEMGQTIDRSMASIGCCPNAQNCCMGGRNVVEPEEGRRIHIVKSSKTAYNPQLHATMQKGEHGDYHAYELQRKQHSCFTGEGLIVKPKPLYCTSPECSSDASNASTPHKIVEEWDKDYGMKIVYKSVDEHDKVPQQQSHAQRQVQVAKPQQSDRFGPVEASNVTRYTALGTLQQPAEGDSRMKYEDVQTTPWPKNNNQTLSPISALEFTGYPASPPSEEGQHDNLNIEQIRFVPIPLQRYAVTSQMRPLPTPNNGRSTSVPSHIEGLQNCTPYKIAYRPTYK